MRTKTSIETMRKYIDQTQALDVERSQLVAELSDLSDSDIERFNAIEKRLNSIYHAQSSNAIILADMLASILESEPS